MRVYGINMFSIPSTDIIEGLQVKRSYWLAGKIRMKKIGKSYYSPSNKYTMRVYVLLPNLGNGKHSERQNCVFLVYFWPLGKKQLFKIIVK